MWGRPPVGTIMEPLDDGASTLRWVRASAKGPVVAPLTLSSHIGGQSPPWWVRTSPSSPVCLLSMVVYSSVTHLTWCGTEKGWGRRETALGLTGESQCLVLFDRDHVQPSDQIEWTGLTRPNTSPSGGEILGQAQETAWCTGERMCVSWAMGWFFFYESGFPAQASDAAWCVEAQCASGSWARISSHASFV
jgi:hypothetical protein